MSVCQHQYKVNTDVCVGDHQSSKEVRADCLEQDAHPLSAPCLRCFPSLSLFDAFRWSAFFPLTVALSARRTGERSSPTSTHGVLPFYDGDKPGPHIT